MRMQADDTRAASLDETLELIQLEQRHTELGVNARGPDLVVVPASVARVDPYEDVAALEELRHRCEDASVR